MRSSALKTSKFSLLASTLGSVNVHKYYNTKPTQTRSVVCLFVHQCISHQINPRCCSGHVVEWVSRLHESNFCFLLDMASNLCFLVHRCRIENAKTSPWWRSGWGGSSQLRGEYRSWRESDHRFDWQRGGIGGWGRRFPHLTKSVIVPGLPGFSTT